MPLPILTTRPQVTPEDLVRFYHRCELHWCTQIAEQSTLDVGTALTNPSLPQVHDANQILDATLQEGISPADALAQADSHFAGLGVRCSKWVLAPTAPRELTLPLAEHLIAAGYQRSGYDILYLSGQPATPIEEVAGLTIIPARASYRHARQLAEESARAWGTMQLADALMLHLEDPQTDALIALKDGVPAALVAVLTVGEIGCVADVFVSEAFRGRGIGRTMMSRALEICARSLFKHVFIGLDPNNGPAQALYANCGFRKIGEYVAFRAPDQARP